MIGSKRNLSPMIVIGNYKGLENCQNLDKRASNFTCHHLIKRTDNMV